MNLQVIEDAPGTAPPVEAHECAPSDPIPEVLERFARCQRDVAALTRNLPPRPPTQAGLAETIADQFDGQLVYIVDIQKWAYFNGCRWELDESSKTLQIAKLCVRGAINRAETAKDIPAARRWQGLETAPRLSGALTLAASDPRLTDSLTTFDADPWLLNTPKGLVDLRTGEITPNKPGHRCLKMAAVTPDYDGEAPIFSRFIRDIADDRDDLAAWIIARLAYALTGDTSLQDIEIRVGSGANGKSVLNALHLALLGDYGTTAPAEILLARDGRHGPSPELLDLQGRRFVAVGETSDGDRLDTALVKRLTGSDEISARTLFSAKMVRFYPCAKFALSTNHTPRLPRVDYAIRRRIRLVPFDRRFEGANRDPKILDRLMEERPAIMGILVRSAQAYARSLELPVCRTVDGASTDFLDDEDPVVRWLSECTRAEPSAITPARDLFENFTQWQERENVRPWSSTAFGRALNDHGFASEKKGTSYRKGLALA